tara:strand:+ start:529 stop:741 length:213 start_codon:yes stop_codon:yes gene_type:complete
MPLKNKEIKPGTLIRVLDPEENSLGNCEYGVVIGKHSDPEAHLHESFCWRVLCGDRVLILMEDLEFEVVE